MDVMPDGEFCPVRQRKNLTLLTLIDGVIEAPQRQALVLGIHCPSFADEKTRSCAGGLLVAARPPKQHRTRPQQGHRVSARVFRSPQHSYLPSRNWNSAPLRAPAIRVYAQVSPICRVYESRTQSFLKLIGGVDVASRNGSLPGEAFWG